MRVSLGNAGLRPLLAFVAALGVLTAGCCLDKVQDPPPLVGPAETGISVQLTALPDTLNADGVSQSTVQLVLRDSDGSPFSGLAVLLRPRRRRRRSRPRLHRPTSVRSRPAS